MCLCACVCFSVGVDKVIKLSKARVYVAVGAHLYLTCVVRSSWNYDVSKFLSLQGRKFVLRNKSNTHITMFGLPASKIPRRPASQTSCTGWAQRPDLCHAHWCHVALEEWSNQSRSYVNQPTYLVVQAAYRNQYPRKVSYGRDHVFWENRIPRCPQRALRPQDRWPACYQSPYKQINCIGECS